MTLAKLQRVLRELCLRNGTVPSGWVGSSPGGELQFHFNGQLNQDQHNGLIRRGFVTQEDGSYVYRP